MYEAKVSLFRFSKLMLSLIMPFLLIMIFFLFADGGIYIVLFLTPPYVAPIMLYCYLRKKKETIYFCGKDFQYSEGLFFRKHYNDTVGEIISIRIDHQPLANKFNVGTIYIEEANHRSHVFNNIEDIQKFKLYLENLKEKQ